jgi:hypothetical protein
MNGLYLILPRLLTLGSPKKASRAELKWLRRMEGVRTSVMARERGSG